MWDFPLFPDEASTIASGVDRVYFLLVSLSVFFTLLVLVLIMFFAIKYRRGSRANRAGLVFESRKLEFVMLFVPLILAMTVFVVQAQAYFHLYRPPLRRVGYLYCRPAVDVEGAAPGRAGGN